MTLIEVNKLNFSYHGTDEATLRDISFNIEKGEIFGFLGPSGAGKSTTQKILIGILKNYTGSVKIDGIEINKVDKSYYEKIGISFELPNHFLKLTAIENMQYFSSLYSKKIDKSDIMKLLEKVGLKDDVDTLVSNFSKGMKNRLNFARALLHDPDILFLDEPTAGLDPVNAKNIMNIIDTKRKEGKTIFLCTHDMMIADLLCDRVAFITAGEINITDKPKSLKIKHGKRTVIVEYGNGAVERQEFEINNLGENKDFIRLINHQYLLTIHSQEASLSDVFINVTGRDLT